MQRVHSCIWEVDSIYSLTALLVSRQSEWATRAKRAQQDWPVNMEIDQDLSLRESVAICGESGSATAAWNKIAFRSTGFAGCMQTSL